MYVHTSIAIARKQTIYSLVHEIDILTVLHLWDSPASTLRASITMSPAMTAFVVAIAGIMFPAIAAWCECVCGGHVHSGLSDKKIQVCKVYCSASIPKFTFPYRECCSFRISVSCCDKDAVLDCYQYNIPLNQRVIFTFNIKSALLLYTVCVRSQVGSCHYKVHSALVILYRKIIDGFTCVTGVKRAHVNKCLWEMIIGLHLIPNQFSFHSELFL